MTLLANSLPFYSSEKKEDEAGIYIDHGTFMFQ